MHFLANLAVLRRAFVGFLAVVVLLAITAWVQAVRSTESLPSVNKEARKPTIAACADAEAVIDLVPPPADFVPTKNADALIGEEFTFEVQFKNLGTQIGYGPFIALVLPASGADGPTNPDGIYFEDSGVGYQGSASYLGTAIAKARIDVLTFSATGVLTHPWAGTFNGKEKDQLVVIQLPFGSYGPTQPTMNIEIKALVKDTADLGVGLPIKAYGGFRYACDALGTQPAILGLEDAATVTPQLFVVSKLYNGPEIGPKTGETATGPNFPRRYTMNVNVAKGQAINDLTVTDLLPNNLAYNGGLFTSSGGINNTGQLQTPAPPTGTAANGSKLVVLFPGTLTGTAAPIDAVVSFSFFVPQLDGNGQTILDPQTGAPVKSENNVIVEGDWLPVDQDDTAGLQTLDPSGPEYTLICKSIALQKIGFNQTKNKAVVSANPPPTDNAPGDLLTWTLDIQVSDYFAFDQLKIEDILSDGQVFQATPSATYSGQDRTRSFLGNFTVGSNLIVTYPLACSSFDNGQTRLQFDLSAVLLNHAPPSGIMTGGHYGGTLTSVAARASISFNVRIQESYNCPQPTIPSGDLSLDQNDKLFNKATVTGRILTTSNNQSDDGAQEFRLLVGALNKTIYARNGVVNQSGEVVDGVCFTPKDTITFRLRYFLPHGDIEKFKLTDFVPLPVLKVPTSLSGGGICSVPSANSWCFHPNNTFNLGPVSVNTDTAANSVTFNFNTFDNPVSTPVLVDLLFTLPVTADPFADGLFLTNQLQASESNSFDEQVAQVAIKRFLVCEPALNLTKGVVAKDGPGTFTKPITPSFTPPPGASGVKRFSSAIISPVSSLGLDSNLNGIDANDLVTFAIVVENQGAHPAYDVRITDTIPAGFVIPSGGDLNLVVTNGIGTLLSYTGAPTDLFTSAGIQLNDPTNGVLGPLGGTLGANIAVITYNLRASWPGVTSPPPPDALMACQSLTNTASLLNYAGIEGGPNFVGSGYGLQNKDSATVTAANATITKCILDANNNCLPAAQAPKLPIGGKARYRVVVTIPEGVSKNAFLVDTLDSGLAIVEPNPPTIGFIKAVPSNATDLVFTKTGALEGKITNSGRTLTFDLGNVINLNTDNTTAERLTVEYTAVVLNTLANERGVKLNNSVQWTAGTCVVGASAPDITIVEPKLKVTKTYAPQIADAGDTVTFTLTIMHDAPPSDAPAYDVLLGDSFGGGTATISNWTCSGVPTSSCTPGNTQWPVFGVNETATITYTATLSSSLKACVDPQNSVFLWWTSLPGKPGQLSPHDPLSFERTWNNLSDPGGAANDYRASTAVTITTPRPTIAKTLTATSAGHTVNPNVAIGEEVTYQLVVCLPQGTAPPQTIKITDPLPPGMEAISATVTSTGGISGLPATLPVTPGLGATQVFSLTNITIPATAATGSSCFTIQLKVRLCDGTGISGLPPNQTLLMNQAKVEIFTPPLQISLCTGISETVTLTVVEPKLEVKKEFIPATAKPGELVQIKLTLTNTGTADAFDIVLTDKLDACLTFVSLGALPTGFNGQQNAGMVTIVGAGTTIKPGTGNALMFTMTVRAGECCAVSNTATATATTMPGNATCERTVTATGTDDLIVTGQNCPCVPAPSGLVDWWTFDETSGAVANDIRGAVNNSGTYGTGSAVPVPTPGVVKGALSFDGGDFVEVGAPTDSEINFTGSCTTLPPLAESFTIDLWLKSTASSGVVTVLDKRAVVNNLAVGYSLFLFNGRVGFQMNAVNFTSTATPIVADGNWHFIAVSVSRCGPPAGGKIYIDGKFEYAFSLGGAALDSLGNNGKLWIGRRDPNTQFGGPNFFTGVLDELEFFKRALSEEELDAIYSAGSGGKCKCVPPPRYDKMIGWWPFDGNGKDIKNGFDGTVQGTGGTFPSAEVGNGWKSGGVGSLIEVPDKPAFGVSSFSLDAWIRVDSLTAANMPIVYKGLPPGADISTPFAFGVAGTTDPQAGRLISLVSNGTNTMTVYSAGVLPLGSFVHVATTAQVTGSSTQLCVYINGVKGNCQTQNIVPQINTRPLQIGGGSGQSGPNGNYFNGPIDELEFWNEALTEEELRSIYQAGSAGKCREQGGDCSQVTINISPTTLPNGVAGQAYTGPTLTASGGTPAYMFSATGLPMGLTMATDGAITGAPMAFGSFTVLVTVKDANGCMGVREYKLNITCANNITMTGSQLPVGTINTAYQQNIIAEGGCGNFTYTLVSGSLPPGLTFSPTGAITGTPTACGTYDFAVKATDKCGCMLLREYRLIIQGTLQTISGLFNTGVNDSGQNLIDGVADPHYSIVIGTNSTPAITRPPGTGWQPPTTFGKWITVPPGVPIAPTMTYRMSFVLGTCDPATVRIEGRYAAFNAASISVNGGPLEDPTATPGYLAFSNFLLTTGFKAGLNTIDFVVTGNAAAGNALLVEFTKAEARCCPCNIVFNPQTLPNGVVGLPYNQTITATGGAPPYTYSVSSNPGLPPGLSLSANGVISGTPTQGGTVSFTIKVTDSLGCMREQRYTVVFCPTLSRPRTYRKGLMDNFAGGFDLAVPSGTLKAAFAGATWKPFDDATIDSNLGHTFATLPTNVVKAELEIRLKPGGTGSDDDTINLLFSQQAATPAWSLRLADVPANTSNSWAPGGPAQTFKFDLASLPNGSNPTVNLVDLLSARQYLDIVVTDDTTVDYVKLRIWTCPPRFWFKGLAVTPFGQAQLSQNASGQLVISNLTTGSHGAFIDVGDTQGLSWSVPFSLALFPENGNLDFTPFGVLDGEPGRSGPLFRLFRSVGGTAIRLSPNFTSLGTQTVRVVVYSGTQKVFDQAGLSSTGINVETGQLRQFIVRGEIVRAADGSVMPQMSVGLDSAGLTPITVGTAFSGQGTQIDILPDRPTRRFESISQFRVTGINFSSITLSDLGIVQRNLVHRVRGDASFDPFGEGLAVAELTPTEARGTAIELGRANSYRVALDTLDPDSTAADGAYLQVETAGGTAAAAAGALRLTKAGDGYRVLANYAALNATSQRIQILNGAQFVAELPGGANPEVTASGWPLAVGRSGGASDGYTAEFPANTSFRVGGTTYTGTQLRLLPVGGSAVEPKTGVTLLAVGLPEFTITDVQTALCQAIAIAPTSLPAPSLNVAYPATQLTASGGTAPYTFFASGLPPGLTLSSSGLLSGTPSQAGTYTLNVTVVDANGCTGVRSYPLAQIVGCQTLTINPATLSNAVVGTPYSQSLTATGGAAPYTFRLSVGVIMRNTVLSPAGIISGTPTEVGTYTFTVEATDANGCQGTRTYTVTVSSGGLMFYPLSKPLHLLDTRTQAARPGPAFDMPNAKIKGVVTSGGAPRVQQARVTFDGVTIPANARAIVGTATVINVPDAGAYTGTGNVTFYPNGKPKPEVSNLNYAANQTISNSFTVGLGDTGAFDIFAYSDVHLVIDVVGYYAPPGEGGLYFHPLPKPVRKLETRPELFYPGCETPRAKLQAGSVRTMSGRFTCDGVTIPAAAQALVGNLTAVNANANGFATVFAGDLTATPLANSLSYVSTQAIPNAFVTRLGNDGNFKLFVSQTTDMLIDLTGYFSAEANDANGQGLLLTLLDVPVRKLETRPETFYPGCITPRAPLNGGSETIIQARGVCDAATIPATAKAIIGNATVINFLSPGSGNVTLYPTAANRPEASNLNYIAEQVIPNAFTVGLSDDGRFTIYVFSTIHLLIDVTGYYAP